MKKNDRQQKLHTVRVNTALSANSPLIAKALALSGQGIALIPDIICFDELKAGIDPNVRAETVPVEGFLALTRAL